MLPDLSFCLLSAVLRWWARCRFRPSSTTASTTSSRWRACFGWACSGSPTSKARTAQSPGSGGAFRSRHACGRSGSRPESVARFSSLGSGAGRSGGRCRSPCPRSCPGTESRKSRRESGSRPSPSLSDADRSAEQPLASSWSPVFRQNRIPLLSDTLILMDVAGNARQEVASVSIHLSPAARMAEAPNPEPPGHGAIPLAAPFRTAARMLRQDRRTACLEGRGLCPWP